MTDPENEPFKTEPITPDTLTQQMRTFYMKSTRALRESSRQEIKKMQLQEAVQDATRQLREVAIQSLDGQHG